MPPSRRGWIAAEPSYLATLADGDVIAAATAQRYCCDAGVVVAQVDAHGVPLSVGRKPRTIPALIKRALLLHDRTCRFPGCTHRRYVDGHRQNDTVKGLGQWRRDQRIQMSGEPIDDARRIDYLV